MYWTVISLKQRYNKFKPEQIYQNNLTTTKLQKVTIGHKIEKKCHKNFILEWLGFVGAQMTNQSTPYMEVSMAVWRGFQVGAGNLMALSFLACLQSHRLASHASKPLQSVAGYFLLSNTICSQCIIADVESLQQSFQCPSVALSQVFIVPSHRTVFWQLVVWHMTCVTCPVSYK